MRKMAQISNPFTTSRQICTVPAGLLWSSYDIHKPYCMFNYKSRSYINDHKTNYEELTIQGSEIVPCTCGHTRLYSRVDCYHSLRLLYMGHHRSDRVHPQEGNLWRKKVYVKEDILIIII